MCVSLGKVWQGAGADADLSTWVGNVFCFLPRPLPFTTAKAVMDIPGEFWSWLHLG